MENTGRALLLAGPMGAGKSALARGLQDLLPGPWLILGDETNVCFPRQRSEFMTLRWDRAVRRGNVKALAGYLDEGLNVLTEWFLWEPWARRITAEALMGRTVRIVKLWCSLDVAQRRLVERGQRLHMNAARVEEGLRWARWQYENEPWNVPYDLLLETDESSPEELADEVAAWLLTEPRPEAIGRLGVGAS